MNVSIPDALQRAHDLLDARQWPEAEAACRSILEVAPDEFEAYLLLGVILYMSDRAQESEAACRQAVALRPQSDQARTNLAAALAAQERWPEAASAYRDALAINPSQSVAHFNLGRMLQRQGFLAQAEAAYTAALAIKPDYAKAEYNRAIVLQEQGRFEQAEAGYRRVLAANPGVAEAANNLGNLLREQGRRGEAEACFRRALESAPHSFTARVNLGLALYDADRLADAQQAFLEAHRTHPKAVEPLSGLATVCRAAGQVEQAEHWLRQALAVCPDSAGVHSTLLFTEQYRPSVTAAELAQAHGQWDARYAQPLRTSWTAYENSFDPERRLRIGFVSADLAEHPVGFLLIGVFEAMAGLCDTVCYYDRPRRDPMVERFRTAASDWRETRAWSDASLTQQILHDRIDVLVDLAGHSGDHRLLLFARKPAPIQATWLGYPGTTGLRTMDYIIADRHQIPEGEESHYSEQVLRLPNSYAALGPIEAPPVESLPATSSGRITLGSFNNPAKINAPTVALWAQILARLPGSRLLLKYPGLDDRLAADHMRQMFALQGISGDRLQLEGRAPRAGLLAAYNRVDIALDPRPYSGGMTTIDALWMGVPVITLPGRTFAGRHAMSYLRTAGLDELVASDEADYVERAVALASDLSRLARLRETLRQRVANSPLRDPARLAGQLMELLRDAWRRRCRDMSAGGKDGS